MSYFNPYQSSAFLDPDASLQAIKGGATGRGGKYTIQGGGDTQRHIQALGRKFMNKMSAMDSAVGFNGLAPAFVRYVSEELDENVCTPFSRDSYLRALLDANSIRFDAFGIDQMSRVLRTCNKTFMIVPVVSRLDGPPELLFDDNLYGGPALGLPIGGGVLPQSVSRLKDFHQFALIQLRNNKGNQTIEYFSPITDYQGLDPVSSFVQAGLLNQIGGVIRNTPPRVCRTVNWNAPMYSLWCNLWTLYYFALRITHPDLSTDAIVTDIQSSIDSKFGSNNKGFLTFLKALYDYFAHDENILHHNLILNNDKIVPVSSFGFDMGASVQIDTLQRALLERAVSSTGLDLLRAFLKMTTSFSLCRCAKADDLFSCVEVQPQSGQVVNHDAAVIKVRNVMGSAGCRQNMFLMVYKIGSNAGLFLYDRRNEISYVMSQLFSDSSSGRVPSLEGTLKTPPRAVAENLSNLINARRISPVLDFESLEGKGQDTGAAMQEATTNTIDAIMAYASSPANNGVWAHALQKYASSDASTKIRALSLTYELDNLFLYYRRISNIPFSGITVRRYDASVTEKLARAQFDKGLLSNFGASFFDGGASPGGINSLGLFNPFGLGVGPVF